MPPAAISRSSTYFPKICGNIPNEEGSALSAALLLTLGLFGCGPLDPVVTEVPVRSHEFATADCRISRDSGTALSLELAALGPFRPGAADSKIVKLNATNEPLGFSPETRGVAAVLSTPDRGGYFGYTGLRTPQGIDVLLWPDHACVLQASAGYPGTAAGPALGFSPEIEAVLVLGEDATDNDPNALLFHTNTASVELPLHDDRAYATVTPFAGGFLIAGGENPSGGEGVEDRERLPNAYPYSPGTGEGEAVTLTWDRTRHGALTLADGATVLIGGYAQTGLVRQFEAIYPESSTSKTQGLASLTVGRLEPVVTRLTDGRILVGGGSLLLGSPVGTVEWFSADATQKLAELALPGAPNRVFAATAGGGALTVASCTDGCASGLEARWLTPEASDGGELVVPDGACTLPDRPWLVPGSDGTVWLTCASENPDSAPLFRFEAWPATYTDAAAVESRPRFEPSEIVLAPPPHPGVAPLSTGPDSFVWSTAQRGGTLAGIRLGARGTLSHEARSLVSSDEARPLHLAPDRPVPLALPPLYENGVLTLSSGELTVWVTDTLYDDVTVTLRASDVVDSAGPGIVFGETLVGGRNACPWPGTPALGEVLRAVRRGARVILESGAGRTECNVAIGAIPIGFRAPGDCASCTSALMELRVERD